MKVDFSYAFAPPHRVTVAIPDSSHKTLLDAEPGKLTFSWTYEDLTNRYVGAYMVPPTPWLITTVPEIDGQAFSDSTWTRADGWRPILVNTYDDERGSFEIVAAGGTTAAVMRVRVTNKTDKPQQFAVHCETASQWARGFNPAWIGLDGPDVLCAGWRDRGDRILAFAHGADEYIVTNSHVLRPTWNLAADESREGWIIRPYRAVAAEIAALRDRDWAAELAAAHDAWTPFLEAADRFEIPDPLVMDAFRAGFADLFVMREPVAGGHIAGIPGTQVYRFTEPFEPGIACVAMDQLGLHDDAERGYRAFLEPDQQPGEGADMRNALQLMWAAAGVKAWVVMEHFKLTGDRDYLESVYPGLLAASRWQEEQRARTRILEDGEKPLDYGLMPRGVGDCGVKDDDDFFGVFLPHNIWAVSADRVALEAAEILGKTEDAEELRAIYETAYSDLLATLDGGAIEEDGYRWIPAVAGKTCSSRWGVLNALFPCRILPADHELITGTIRHMEANLSPGGMPLNLGWLPDGLWMSIALDNLAQAHLARGEGDEAVAYLYNTINHGTPLFSWCEERGKEADSTETAGDPQHLWTPVALVRCVRDCLVIEDRDGLQLALATDRDWLAGGDAIAVTDAPTYFGRVSFRMQFDAAASLVTGTVTFAEDSAAEWVVLHIRLPDGRRAVSVDAASGAAVLEDISAIRWDQPRGSYTFNVSV